MHVILYLSNKLLLKITPLILERSYQAHKQRIQAARLQYYDTHRNEEIAVARARNIKNAKAVLRRARKYYVRHGPRCRSDARWRYELAEPTRCYAKEQHVLELTKKLMLGSKVLQEVQKCFQGNDHFHSGYQFNCSQGSGD